MHGRAITAAATAAALLAAGAVAGCGGGSDFASKADSICKDTTAKLTAITRPKTAAELGTYLDRVSSVAHAARTKLGSLKPPGDKKAAYAAYLAALEAQIGIFDKTRAVAHAGKTKEAVAMLRAGQPGGRAVKARAKALGLKECSK